MTNLIDAPTYMAENVTQLNEELNGLRERVEHLQVELQTTQRERDMLRQQRDEANQRFNERNAQWFRELETLSEVMLEAASDHSMCHVYDEAVEEVNRRNQLLVIPERTRDYRVYATVAITVSISATDEDSASESAWEEIRSALRNAYVDYDDITITEVDLDE